MRRILGGRRTFAALVVAVVLAAVLIGWLRDDGADGSADPSTPAETDSQSLAPTDLEPGEETDSGPAFPTAVAPSHPETDPASGLAVVELSDLPPEAAETVELIDAGGPFPYAQDDGTFGNFEGLLPDREDGYYREYTVETPGSEDRGARRIVAGEDGELYWTDDHYASFRLIER